MHRSAQSHADLELKARSQTSAALKLLLGLVPKTARRIEADGSEADVPLTHVHVGDRLLWRLATLH